MPLAPPSAPAKSYLVSFTPDRSRTTSLPAKKPLERRSQPSNSPSHSVMGSSGVSARQERATAKTKRVPRLSYARHAPSHDWSAKLTLDIPARVSDSHARVVARQGNLRWPEAQTRNRCSGLSPARGRSCTRRRDLLKPGTIVPDHVVIHDRKLARGQPSYHCPHIDEEAGKI